MPMYFSSVGAIIMVEKNSYNHNLAASGCPFLLIVINSNTYLCLYCILIFSQHIRYSRAMVCVFTNHQLQRQFGMLRRLLPKKSVLCKGVKTCL